MKYFVILVMMVIMAFSFAACGAKPAEEPTTVIPDTTVAEVEETTEA